MGNGNAPETKRSLDTTAFKCIIMHFAKHFHFKTNCKVVSFPANLEPLTFICCCQFVIECEWVVVLIATNTIRAKALVVCKLQRWRRFHHKNESPV